MQGNHAGSSESRPGPRVLWPVLFAIVIAAWTAAAWADDATNVTAVVAAAVKDNKLAITAGNEAFGDTAPGVPKKLHVEYRIGSEQLHARRQRRGPAGDRRAGRPEAGRHEGRLRPGRRLETGAARCRRRPGRCAGDAARVQRSSTF